MSITLQENIETCRDHITFTFDKPKVDEVVNEIVKRMGKAHTFKGFRKGKAPPQAIKAMAKDAILQETQQRLMNEAYKDIIFETKLKPFGEPEVSKIDISYSQFSIDMKLAYVPSFELTKYKGFDLSEPLDIPTEENVIKETVLDLCKKTPNLRSFGEDDFVMDGDSIIIEYSSTIDGAEFPHNSASGVVIEMGAGKFVRDFEVNVMGMKVGDKREFDVTFPEDVSNKAVAGKTVHFTADLTSAVKKDMPAFDEDFAKKLGYESLDVLNQRILDHVKNHIVTARKNVLKKMIFDNLLESNTIEVPEWMQIKSAQSISESKGLKWEENNEAVRTQLIEDGFKTLKLSMIFDKIRELEVETVLTQNEIQATLYQNINKFPHDVQKSLFDQNNTGRLARLYSEIQDEQVFEWIIKNSTVAAVVAEEVPTATVTVQE